MKDSGKLIKDEKVQVLQWLAEFNSPSNVKQMLHEQFNKTISVQAICGHQKRHAEIINGMRKEFLSEIEELPIAHKKMRLLWRQKMCEDILKFDDTSRYYVVNRILDSAASELELFNKFSNTGSESDSQVVNQHLKNIAEELRRIDTGS